MRLISITFLFLCVMSSLYSQSIRKNYQEMTLSEKAGLVNGLYELRNGPDLVNDLAQFHTDNFNFGISEQLDLHFNLPNEPQRQIFFSWHRMQMFEMEQALQEIDPNISLPWWDSSADQSLNSPLFDYDFMGQFDTTWGLNRNIGGNGPMPTPQTISDVQVLDDFLVYSNVMERGDAHRGAHVWIGGVMSTPLSPRDPIFYLHHTYIDKLWKDWVTENPGNSSFIITSMLRYDGTYTFDGKTLPLVDPDTIIDSAEALGVFYAEDGLAELHNYVVKNKTQNIENFYYQYTIDLGNGFQVPDTKNCKVQSVNEINLTPGFDAQYGSNFIAAIDVGQKSVDIATIRKENFFSYDAALHNIHAFDSALETSSIKVLVYPNPFSDLLTIDLQQEVQSLVVEVLNISGRLVLTKAMENTSLIAMPEVKKLNSGFYIVRVIANGQLILSTKVIKK